MSLSLRRPIVLAALVAVAAFSLLAAGCGGGSSGAPSVASTSPTSATTTTQTGLVAYSHCMRSHGVSSFPEPQRVGGRALKLTIQRLVTGNPQFRSAQRACNHLLPNGGAESQTTQPTRAQVAAELSFARCMRSHGEARFPDPNGQGELSVEMVQANGIDVHSPAVLRVVQTCLPASHGWLTPAKVRQALSNTG
jgi:hypothetical protein